MREANNLSDRAKVFLNYVGNCTIRVVCLVFHQFQGSFRVQRCATVSCLIREPVSSEWRYYEEGWRRREERDIISSSCLVPYLNEKWADWLVIDMSGPDQDGVVNTWWWSWLMSRCGTQITKVTHWNWSTTRILNQNQIKASLVTMAQLITKLTWFKEPEWPTFDAHRNFNVTNRLFNVW